MGAKTKTTQGKVSFFVAAVMGSWFSSPATDAPTFAPTVAATLAATFAPSEDHHHEDHHGGPGDIIASLAPSFAPTEAADGHHSGHHGLESSIGPENDHSIGSLFFLIAIVSILCYFVYRQMQKNKEAEKENPTVAINFQMPELNVTSRKYGYQVIADEA